MRPGKCISFLVNMVPDLMGRQSLTTKNILTSLYDEQIKPKIIKVCRTIDFTQTYQCAIVDPRYIDLAWRITL